MQLYQDMTSKEKDDFWRNNIKKSVLKEETKKQSKKQEFTFICRLCKCTQYEGIYTDSSLIIIGKTQYPNAYQCSECSVIFKDPERFTKKE